MVQALRRQVSAVRPYDRAQRAIEPQLAEVVGIAQRLEDGTEVSDVGKVQLAGHAVFESQTQEVSAKTLHCRDARHLGTPGHGNGSTGARGSCCRPRLQLSSSSPLWSLAQRRIMPRPRRGMLPARTARVSMS